MRQGRISKQIRTLRLKQKNRASRSKKLVGIEEWGESEGIRITGTPTYHASWTYATNSTIPYALSMDNNIIIYTMATGPGPSYSYNTTYNINGDTFTIIGNTATWNRMES